MTSLPLARATLQGVIDDIGQRVVDTDEQISNYTARLKKVQANRLDLLQLRAELIQLLANATLGDAMARPARSAKNETRQTDIRHPNGGIQTVTEIVRPDPQWLDKP